MKTDDIYRSQFRLPYDLYEKLKAEADKYHRSLNAEIVTRLNESFLTEAPPQELPPADRAKEMATLARRGLSKVVKQRILTGIHQAVSMGHAMAIIDFNDMQLDSLPQADLEALINTHSAWLEEAGYSIEWDGPDSLWISFDAL